MSLLLRVPLSGLALCLSLAMDCGAVEQRDEVFRTHALFNEAFFWKHNAAYRSGAALHIAHAAQHDWLLLKGDEPSGPVDQRFDSEMLDRIAHPPHTEPTQEYYAPYTSRTMWRLLRTIEWTHVLHEETYDILADDHLDWNAKHAAVEEVTAQYLHTNDVALSCAPLDLVMRRTGVMMKPYFTVFRTRYPLSNNLFYAAHWWHPAIYEALMIGGGGEQQQEAVMATERVFRDVVLSNRPMRMLIGREMMPRYASFSPQSTNVFDTLHMLHGITYDILAFEGWTVEQKQAEVYRILEAMRYRPGDELLAPKFSLPHPEVDPRRYEAWMHEGPGEMGRIMIDMHDEMMPPGDDAEAKAKHSRMTEILKLKMMPGRSGDEPEGSFMDAIMKLMPDHTMDHAHQGPGMADQAMLDHMDMEWRNKHKDDAVVPPYTVSHGVQP